MSALTVRERVARGVALLDERGPESWRDKIDPARLNVASGLDCVLGQVFGDYITGRQAMGLTGDEWQYGFDAASPPRRELPAGNPIAQFEECLAGAVAIRLDYLDLAREWREELRPALVTA